MKGLDVDVNHTTFSEIGHVRLEVGSYKKLRGSGWLDGDVIATFLDIVFNTHNPRNDVLHIGPIFYTLLMGAHEKALHMYSDERNYRLTEAVEYITRSWTRQDFSKDIVIAVHQPGHWILAIIVPSEETIIVLDGMDIDRSIVFNVLIRWYADILLLSFKEDCTIQWQRKAISDFEAAPRQTDHTSCGVIACMFAYTYIKTGRRIANTLEDWSQADVSKLRLFMANVIYTNRNLRINSGIDQPEKEIHEIENFRRLTEIHDLTYL